MSDDKDALIYLANVRIDELDAENAKLREELEKWNRLAENIELPEYPVTEFHPKDLERENAKLRELVRDMYTVMVTDAANCDVTYPEQFDGRMRELGIEVDDGNH